MKTLFCHVFDPKTSKVSCWELEHELAWSWPVSFTRQSCLLQCGSSFVKISKVLNLTFLKVLLLGNRLNHGLSLRRSCPNSSSNISRKPNFDSVTAVSGWVLESFHFGSFKSWNVWRDKSKSWSYLTNQYNTNMMYGTNQWKVNIRHFLVLAFNVFWFVRWIIQKPVAVCRWRHILKCTKSY